MLLKYNIYVCLCLCLCLSVSVCNIVYECKNMRRPEKMWELELGVVVNSPTWILETKLRSSATLS